MCRSGSCSFMCMFLICNCPNFLFSREILFLNILNLKANLVLTQLNILLGYDSDKEKIQIRKRADRKEPGSATLTTPWPSSYLYRGRSRVWWRDWRWWPRTRWPRTGRTPGSSTAPWVSLPPPRPPLSPAVRRADQFWPAPTDPAASFFSTATKNGPLRRQSRRGAGIVDTGAVNIYLLYFS